MAMQPYTVWQARRSRQSAAPEPLKPDPYRRDRARIIHSSTFRRLQTKMQVLDTSAGDFPRTRLTHSLEVAQIGGGIVDQIQERRRDVPDALRSALPTESLIEAICLAHDIGHPPFGHGGEVALDFAMREHGGFEANGQTLRLLNTEPHEASFGLDLTRRTLLGVLKYPAPYSLVCNRSTEEYGTRPSERWKPPKCYLDQEATTVKWLLEPFSEADRKRFTEIEHRKDGHHRPKHKSLDTTIMDLADDIAYGVHDLEDGIAVDLISRDHWDQQGLEGASGLDNIPDLRDRLFSGKSDKRKQAVGDLVHAFMTALQFREDAEFDDDLLRWTIDLEPAARDALNKLQELTRSRIIHSFGVRTLEWRGQEMIRNLFEVFASYPHTLLRESDRNRFLDAERQSACIAQRVVCDYIAGMSDEYATRIYERLFIPRNGSTFERL